MRFNPIAQRVDFNTNPTGFFLLSLAITLSLGSLLTLTAYADDVTFQNTPTAPSSRSALQRSRLSQLMLQYPALTVPTQLMIGEANKVIVKTQPGYKVHLFVSPAPEGYRPLDHLSLRVGAENQLLDAVANDKGVAIVNIHLPNEPGLQGQQLFLDAVTFPASFEDLKQAGEQAQQVVLLDGIGQKTNDNTLKLAVRATGKGTMLIPGMPGLSSDMMRRLGTLTDVAGDPRKKQLVDTGARDTSLQLDRNTFIMRPDGTGGLGGR